MADDKPWHRRIIICCDGTWQSSVSGTDNVPSNVTKLCRHIARIGIDSKDPDNIKKFHQLVYYDSGVGTGNLADSERRRQGGTGAGLAENVIEAYNFIVLNYAPGDEIFCFGFSRGAYTARAVAGLVTDIGVLKPVDMQIFPQVYRKYQLNKEGKSFRDTQAWRDFVEGKLSAHGEEIDKKQREASLIERSQSWEINPHPKLEVSDDSRKVKVVGVWDTVGALGIPDMVWWDKSDSKTKFGFHNVKLNGYIEHAFQALALDERRKPFRPTLWYIPKGMANPPELKQVWFPGVHINCGGGSDDAIGEMQGDLENLSNATFAWMLQCIAPHITIDQPTFHASMAQYERFITRTRHACTYYHPGWIGWAKSMIPKIPFIQQDDPLAPPKRDKPHPHPKMDFGYGTGEIVDSYTGMYKAQWPVQRVPGHCSAEIYKPGQPGEDGVYELEDIEGWGESNEYIHPICHYRDLIRGPEFNSALKDFNRFKQGGRFWWQKTGDTKKLPEWIIMPDVSNKEVNFERSWYYKCEETRQKLEDPDKKEEKLAKLKKADYENWLQVLDSNNDFSVGEKQGWVYP